MPKVKFVYVKKDFDMVYEDIDKNENVIQKFIKIIGEKDLFILYKGKSILENEDILNKIKNKIKNLLILKLIFILIYIILYSILIFIFN